VKQGGRTARRTSSRRDSRRATSGYNYVEGNTIRENRVYPDIPQPELRQIKNYKVKPIPMNKGYIFVMAASVILVCLVLMSYVKLQSEITNHISNISSLESELNDKKLANDETYTKIMSSVDLDEIKRIAVNELGMKYAKEGQVIEYEGEGNDYVRQYSDIPQ
jgi:cell division protein FtsL